MQPVVENYRWITCKGCGGDVGIPADVPDGDVNCPECGWTVRAAKGLLYRPPSAITTSQKPTPDGKAADKLPSPTLLRKADTVMICGILSIFLGWTVLIPFVGAVEYLNGVLPMAKEENVSTPSKATIGFVLSLLFGIGQAITVLPQLVK